MMCRGTTTRRHPWPQELAAIAVFLAGTTTVADEGRLEQFRDDVRAGPPSSGPPPGPAAPSTDREEDRPTPRQSPYEPGHVGDGMPEFQPLNVVLGAGLLSAVVATSPIWAPRVALQDDDFGPNADFPRFPYDELPGYPIDDANSLFDRSCAARVSAEYLDPFDGIHIVAGRFLLSSRSRWGLDTQWGLFQEGLPNGRLDQLWLGDANLVFRFAQGERAEFRTGVGFNWLADAAQADLGFNFTYGFDLFPRPPWVLSTDIDWGTLGKAGLLRFQTTVGAVLHGVEVYTGYQYLDVSRTHLNSLIGGVRIWF